HAAGPILAGFLIARLDYRLTFGIMAAMLLAALPVFVATIKINQAPA
ncbi:MAG: MFS transporter, partial [Deltaproteobacteria bacterium CG_4_10_14_3_um_filter_60_8]